MAKEDPLESNNKTENPLLLYSGKGMAVDAKNVEQFISWFQEPVKSIGMALHTEFSGINLRGIKTHDVAVSRPTSFSNASRGSIEGIDIEFNDMVIVSALSSEEVKAAGMGLKLLFNQLQLNPEDLIKGVAVLRNYHQDVEESKGYFKVGLIINPESYKTGKSGLLLENYGQISLLPKPSRSRASIDKKEFRSDQEARNYDLLGSLSNAKSSGFLGVEIFHPLLAAAITDAAVLVAKAIYKRKITPSFIVES